MDVSECAASIQYKGYRNVEDVIPESEVDDLRLRVVAAQQFITLRPMRASEEAGSYELL